MSSRLIKSSLSKRARAIIEFATARRYLFALPRGAASSSVTTAPARASIATTNPAPYPSIRLTLFLCAVLLALSAATFYPVVHNGFINLDDPSYVTLNAQVQKGLTWDSLKWAFTTFHTGNWHPLAWMSHMLDYQIFGERVWGHHLTSLVLHCLATSALFLVLRGLTGTLWRSFFVAAFFGVHPLRIESVAWVAERKDVLSTLFFLLTLGAYARFVRLRQFPLSNEQSRGTAGRGTHQLCLWYVIALVLFALGLMSKPMLVTLPFVLLLLDFWPLQRPEFQACTRRNFTPLTRLLVEKIPFFLLAAISCVVTMLAQRAGGIVVSSGGIALLERAENALVSYCRYLGKLFWPARLAVFYPLPSHWPPGTVLAAAVLLLAISAFALWMWKRAPFLAMGWAWFVGTLVPVIGLIQVGHQAIADSYTYIPSIGVFLAVVWSICAIAEHWSVASPASGQLSLSMRSASHFLFPAAALVLLFGAVFLTRRQLAYWKDSESLFRRTLAVTGNNPIAHDTLGLALRIQGRLDESSAEMREAIRINPSYAGAYRDLGYNLTMQSNLDEGIRLLQTALRLVPSLPRTHKQLGLAFQQQGHLNEALLQFQAELEISPEDAEAHNSLGATFLSLGRLGQAVSEFYLALRWNPSFPEPHNNLGIALCRQAHWPEGISQFEDALHLNPEYAEAHNNLGVALAQTGRRDEAVRHFKEALRIRPNYPGAELQLRALTTTP